MSDRPHPILEASACPFVAFDDDRDRRSEEPDHRHRCFAEPTPAPRALAHQHAYCLSSSFAACPTFQDWARRESAAVASARATAGDAADVRPGTDGAGVERRAAASDAPAARTPPPRVDVYDQEALAEYRRDWAAPPPWLGGPPSSDADRSGVDATPRDARREPLPLEEEPAAAEAPAFLAARQRSPERSPDRPAPPARPAAPPDPDRGFFGPAPADAEPWESEPDDEEPGRAGSPPAASGRARSEAMGGQRDPGRTRGEAASSRGDDVSPSWEPRRRLEAYPTIRTPMRLPSLNGLGLALIALLVAAVALFFLPMLWAPKQPGSGGGSGQPTATPSSAAASPSASASVGAPSPTAKVYVVKAGDTLSRVAAKLGVPLDALISANPQLKDPNKLQIGDQLNVPSAGASELPAGSASASP